MYIPWIRYGRPCTDSKKIITDNRVRSPKQRVVERILFMFKTFCASREVNYQGRNNYVNGWGMLRSSLLNGGKCASTANDLSKEKNIKCNTSCQLDSLLGEVTGLLLS